jgi:uncharacterized repeat protein (TIGR03843 family)
MAALLTEGAMTVHGRIPGSSNVTLLVTCELDELETLAVYKPERGERDLWDFPPGLWRREVAAFVLSQALGWDLVPDTFRRAEGPYGEGSVQRFVEEDGESHYFTLREEERWRPTLLRLAVFDVVANNADRKSGHVLLAHERLWAIDNGLCFHRDTKLRTVIWDYAGEPVPADAAADLERLAEEGPPDELAALLDDAECAALLRRIDALLHRGTLPAPRTERPYPWPLV